MRASTIGFLAAAGAFGLLVGARSRSSRAGTAPAPAPRSPAASTPPVQSSVPIVADPPTPPTPPTPPLVQPGLYNSTEMWRPYVTALAPMLGIPVPFVMRWIQNESGGNPCSCGFPGEVDARGQPLETGILQLMSPDDIRLAGTTVAEMRIGCSDKILFPGLTRSSPDAAKHAARIAEETQLRPLTHDEMKTHAAKSMAYLAGIMQIVDRSLARYGVAWAKSSPDYWMMVKAYHAGEGIPTGGYDEAIKGLGRAPTTWNEFKQGLHSLQAQGHAPMGLRPDQWVTAITNAEKTGAGAFA